MGQLLLSADEVKLIRDLHSAGVLRDVEEDLLDLTEGSITITCSDGDQFHDIYTHQAKLQKTQREEPRIHLFAWNGGPLRLVCKSPANTPHRTTDQDAVDDICEAREMKDITAVALVIHAPCGKAAKNRIDLEQEIELCHRAKGRLKEEGFVVSCFMQICYPELHRRTYFLERKSWENWKRDFGSWRHWTLGS